jgi:phosphate/sulfate permease
MPGRDGTVAAAIEGRAIDRGGVPALASYRGAVDNATRFIPVWVKVAVAIALGLGTMAASGSGLQWGTVRGIALAWVLTLPAAILPSGTLYFVLRQVF